MAKAVPFVLAFVSGGLANVANQHLMSATVASGIVGVLTYAASEFLRRHDPKKA
jgi:hypothetical protein